MLSLSRLSVAFFLASIAFSIGAAAERKMGIELEMDNIKFDDTNFKGEDLRHLRLLTVKKGGEETGLYQVPFLSTEDSMGSFQWKDDFLGHAILEVRRTANFFGESDLYKEDKVNGAFSRLPNFLSTEAERVRSLK